jgi:hypothetical protein
LRFSALNFFPNRALPQKRRTGWSSASTPGQP